MTTKNISQNNSTFAGEARWKELYTVGGITCILSIAIIVLGVVAYFIWPYLPGYTTTEQIFSVIQEDALAGLISLDFFLVVGNLFSILLILAMYVSLKRINEAYALIAVVLGLIGMTLIIPARPIVEIFTLSDLYAHAASDAARNQYLAAGDAMFSLFDGTSFATNTVFGAVSLLVSSLLMLRSTVFGKAAGWVGIITNVAVLGFWIPGAAGTLLLFLSLPGYIIWYILIAPKFFQLGRSARTTSLTSIQG